VVLVGLGRPLASLPIVNAAIREIDIRGVFRYANCYPAALSLIASGRIDVKPLITHRYTIKESVQAFEMAESGQAIKVMVSDTIVLQSVLNHCYSRFNVAMRFNSEERFLSETGKSFRILYLST
jgi:hypothetical protein